MQSLFSESLRLYTVSRIANLEHKYFEANLCKDLNHRGFFNFMLAR